MKRKLILSNQFKRDFKRQKIEVLLSEAWIEIISCLRNGTEMSEARKNHPLNHDKKGLWDCHLFNDIVLLYSFDDECVELIRLGTHEELGLTK